MPGQHYGFGGLAFGCDHRPDRTYLGRFHFGGPLARRKHQRNTAQHQENPPRTVFYHCEFLTSGLRCLAEGK
jgi:hypothetical protein